MAPAQQSRVLRCCSCLLFQAHQVKKSLQWTCKACGEKQSFIRAYGEGSGADCRRHVQKLNLLQGQVSELPPRSVDKALKAGEEENACPQQDENWSLQGKSQPLESRWVKYLDNSCEEQELGGGAGLQTQPSASAEQLGNSFSSAQPKKRKWSQSTEQSSRRLHVQDVDSAEGTLECQGFTGMMRTQQQSISPGFGTTYHTRELGFPRWKLPGPTLQLKAPSSKWARFLLSPGNVDTVPSRPLQGAPQPADPAQAEEPPETETPSEGHFSRSPSAHFTMSRPENLDRKTPEQWTMGTPQAGGGPLGHGEQKGPSLQLQHPHHLFTTGEDFEDDL